ncbi:MAG: hypothetical protein EXR72_26170 [Myxococcales bacterium]|nr:hypothetical protein [Myxococcales bacterium]
MIGAREAMGRGLRALGARPSVTVAALVGGAGAGLCGRAAFAAAGRVAQFGEPASWAWALLLLVLGGTLAALLGAWALAGALVGAHGSSPRQVLGEAVRRGIAILSLQAIERVIYGTLLLAIVAPSLRGLAPGGAPLPSAAAVTLVAAPAILVVLLALPAFRVAIVETAAGVPSHFALGHGLARTLDHLPSLLSLWLTAIVFTAPLWGAAIALDRFRDAAPPLLVIPVSAAQGALGLAALLWGYSALHALVASEERG